MKKIILFLIVATVTFGFSQTTNKGEPKSWSFSDQRQVEKINVQTIDIQKIVNEDAISDLITGKPYRIGIKTTINYGLNNSGIWTNLPNGDRFWRFNISSKDALHLSVNFNDFYIPEGASLYLYNNDKSDLQGAYTKLNNNEHNALGSWFIKGDNLWVEYFEPSEVTGQGRIHLSEIIHGYRLGKEHQNQDSQRALNDSGACNQDVDCFIGADFDAMKEELKHSVAFLSMGNGYICSGGLINNVNNDKTPFFLTANHCYTDPNNIPSNPALYAMRFNWITNGTPRCATFTNSSPGPTNFTMNGSTLRARSTISDFMLVELNTPVPDTWDIRYAGWDRTDTNPTYEVGIHHPSGDIMKVCRDDTGATKRVNAGAQTWDINGIIDGGANSGSTGWEIGVTEGGSSGSPLFDQNGRVIGQLYGGHAACSGTNDNNRYDYYGRFGISWTGNGTNSTRLSNWLDPSNTGTTTVDMLDQSASVDDAIFETSISVYPNPSKGIITIDLGNLLGDFSYEIINIMGQKLKANTLTTNASEINLENLSANVYFVKITDHINLKSIVKKIVLQR